MPERNNDEPGRRDDPAGERPVPAIRWDETNARTISPNICTISATRKEFALLFGTRGPRYSDNKGIIIPNAERIVISPYLAKRISTHLNDILEKYEARFGPLEPAASPGKAGSARSYTRESYLSRLESLPEKGRALLQLLTGLCVGMSFERSFKITEGRLLTNRFLVAISRRELQETLEGRILPILEQMAMPPTLIQEFNRSFPDSNHIYFGFEENERTSLYKVYLEFRDRIEAEIKAGKGSSSLPLFWGFKWDLSDPTRKATTRYDWYPSLPVLQILERLPGMIGRDPLAIAEAVVALAAERLSCEHIQYVEATEEGSPRRSFDINVYKGGLYLDEFHPWLIKLTEYYRLPTPEFGVLYDRIRSKRLGHLAGGIDREGKDFLTFYYGVEDL